MPKRYLLPVVEFHLLIFLIALAVITKPSTLALSATTHVVISEVQLGGGVADDEFVELYNPTETTFDLASWRLTKTTQGGTEASNLVASLSGTMTPHSYKLIASPEYDGSTSFDIQYSTSNHLAENNTVSLYSDAGSTLVDRVGMGTATLAETAPFGTNPADNGSIERKPGASDPTGGNGTDTENNANDFDLRGTSEPQNSTSTETPAPDATPSPTPDASPSPTPEATPDISPSPSVIPETTPNPTPDISPSPSPETSPSPTPVVSPSPTPEVTPSSTPDASPSPTPDTSLLPTPVVSPLPSATPETTPSPSATPDSTPSSSPQASASPTPVPSPSASPEARIFFRGFLFTCSVHYVNVNAGWFSFSLPRFSCSRNG